MPATWYQPYWRQMDAFALPSFYDGRIRINLAGRERHGTVPLDRYESVVSRLENELLKCRSIDSNQPVVARIVRNLHPPMDLQPSQSDLYVVWNGATDGLIHPVHGQIGPLPFRRPGGHTGGDGIAYFHGHGFAPGTVLHRSAFDVVPTIVELLGEKSVGLSGKSFAADLLEKVQNHAVAG